MSETAKLFNKQLSLTKLEIEVAAFEALTGPLKALGYTQDKTGAIYEDDMAPDNPVELQLKAGDAIPDGYELVCSGIVWVLGETREINAVRKT